MVIQFWAGDGQKWCRWGSFEAYNMMRQVSSYKNRTQGILRWSIGGHWRYKWPHKCWCGSRLDHFTHDGKGSQNMDNWLNCWSFKLMTKAGKEHGRFECSLWMHLSEAYKRFKTMSIGELNRKFSGIFSGKKKIKDWWNAWKIWCKSLQHFPLYFIHMKSYNSYLVIKVFALVFCNHMFPIS